MKKYIGIGKESDDEWYCISLFLGDKMLKLTMYTPKHKMPTYYYYDKESFEYCLEQEVIRIKWFFGIILNND